MRLLPPHCCKWSITSYVVVIRGIVFAHQTHQFDSQGQANHLYLLNCWQFSSWSGTIPPQLIYWVSLSTVLFTACLSGLFWKVFMFTRPWKPFKDAMQLTCMVRLHSICTQYWMPAVSWDLHSNSSWCTVPHQRESRSVSVIETTIFLILWIEGCIIRKCPNDQQRNALGMWPVPDCYEYLLSTHEHLEFNKRGWVVLTRRCHLYV